MNPVAVGALLFFLAFLAFYAVWSLFLVYHLLKFAPARDAAVVAITLFAGVTAVLLLVSAAALLRLDWSAPFVIPLPGF